jgi:hypothetical protein
MLARKLLVPFSEVHRIFPTRQRSPSPKYLKDQKATKGKEPVWTLADEKKYLDHLGDWSPRTRLSRRQLLRRYIESTQKRNEPWAAEAVEYAKQLLRQDHEEKTLRQRFHQPQPSKVRKAPQGREPVWTLADEKKYLDYLGNWSPKTRLSRSQLLRKYIEITQTRVEPWVVEAVEYARQQLRQEYKIEKKNL